MENETYDFAQTAPSLTLTPELDEAPVPAVQPAAPQTQADEPVLTAAEKQMIDDFAAKRLEELRTMPKKEDGLEGLVEYFWGKEK